MGTGGTPTIPLFIGQGALGVLEGTPGDKQAGIDAGDGVMIAGDVRALARNYCAQGAKVRWAYDALGRMSLVPWLPNWIAWVHGVGRACREAWCRSPRATRSRRFQS